MATGPLYAGATLSSARVPAARAAPISISTLARVRSVRWRG
jgi:hypothetical protein